MTLYVCKVLLELQDTLYRLENVAAPGRRGYQQDHGRQPSAVKANKVVKNFMAANLLVNRSKLKLASERMLAASFPRLAPQQIASMRHKAQVSHGGELSSSQLFIDTAFCKYWSHLLQPGNGFSTRALATYGQMLRLNLVMTGF